MVIWEGNVQDDKISGKGPEIGIIWHFYGSGKEIKCDLKVENEAEKMLTYLVIQYILNFNFIML